MPVETKWTPKHYWQQFEKNTKTLKLNIAVALLLKFYSFSKSYNMSNGQIMLSKYKKNSSFFLRIILFGKPNFYLPW